ncbi:MMPL family transporter [Gordonia sp. HY002]|uniref:MMPL family transporter n=1 Tax=Gordonia zhenghanii TaxID=2911516 RepID=UPI001EEFFBAA|nr:MMPL family transporter [Gordonia zhenghanii]MCF8569253.1 MMPL family transporter [Gordonia zhenghanii]MCF8605365.1 MMPL family transporter [Gordonia zhenghanii]
MFGSIGSFVYRMRYAVIAVLIALMGGLGLYGMDLSKHLSQSGWFDPQSESVTGSVVADEALGRDHKSDVILLITPPEGTSIDDEAFGQKMLKLTDDLIAEHPDVVSREVDDDHAGLISPFDSADNGASQIAADQKRDRMWTDDRRHGFISIGVNGNDDTTILKNYKSIEPFFDGLDERYELPGTQFELAGLQPIASAMSDGMDADIHRAEVIALPVVAIMLLFVFGGVVAAILPVFIGGLTIAGSLGITKLIAQATELNIFAQSVITLIGLGIAIDYGLFVVSRFREELAEGYTPKAAIRRTVMTSGQTVVFSATIIVAALACLLMFPQAFLKSVAYGAIASVGLAAILSITVLPAILAILGRRVDALSLPFLNRTKTREEVEAGFWGKLASWVMKHPLKTAIPTVLLLLALIIPFGNIAFTGLSEKLLPPDNQNRIAQQHFDELFPTERTEELKLVVVYDQNGDDVATKLQSIADEANTIPGFTKPFSPDADGGALDGIYGNEQNGLGVTQMSAGLQNRDDAPDAITSLRDIDTQGLRMYVAGTPALTQDSIDGLMTKLPYMAILLVLVSGLLMFLAFGSVILPIKAALMTALGLGSTLGILTWIFIDGHGSSIANFTPGPLFAPILVLIIAIIYGLSTDYEIFLLSRMVEARQNGASTTEAIRVGTANTGRIITAAAAILVVVTGAFGLSDIVMMKYIAYGMIAALILDATVIRMLLVPAVMKLLGDDCWWSPRWMQRLQQKIGLGETTLGDEPDEKENSTFATLGASSGGVVAAAEAPTTSMKRISERPVAGRAEPTGARRALSRRDEGSDVDASDTHGTESTLDELISDDAPAKGPETAAKPAAKAVPRTAAPKPAAPKPAGPKPAAGANAARPRTAAPAPAQASTKRKSDGPDTGSWRLGAGGVRQTSRDLRPRPQQRAGAPVETPDSSGRVAPAQQPVRPQRPTSQPLPAQRPTPAQRATGSPAPRGPQPRPTAPQPRPRQAPPTPQTPAPPTSGRRPAPESQSGPPRSGPPRSGTPQTGTPQTGTPQTGTPQPASDNDEQSAESRSARELRPDRGNEGNQISVQELLRRSRGHQSDED